ncbi:hypothetical protein, conserved [Eimeria tenella]|uniref:Uncharacterized protein n=1 Tax=Eimeria tenella TaxID=5802 RepID=U6L0G5_EIMTE|nr:hypothetical protein, conserved [Eimeria tenella]CDJ42678.1 hypothetical protein, conserved [Eimeria tenella]|eukprot:XP_013233428.1 hypothetical protein, conserved [Eimeria tenella]
MQTAGAAWDIEGLLGLRGTLQQLPSNSSPTNSEKVAKGAVDSANRGAATPPAATAAATTAATAVATAAEPAEAAEGIHQKARQDNAECAIIWAKAVKNSHVCNAVCNSGASAYDLSSPSCRRAEQQKLKHELLLLRRRQQVAASALRAQHDAKVAAAKAAWEAERRKLVYKNQTLQATVDQTLACYEEDVRLLGEVRGSVLQAQEQQQQEQQKLLQQQLQHALQAERDHWSARLKAIQDEWSRKLEDERRQAQTRLHQAQQNRVQFNIKEME